MNRYWSLQLVVGFTVAIVGFGAMAQDSQLSGGAYVSCSGSEQVVTVSGSYFFGQPGEYTGIVLERQAVGVCEPSQLLLDQVLPFEPVQVSDDIENYEVYWSLVPPTENLVYRYIPFAVASTGDLVPIVRNCGATVGYGLSDCVSAPVARGTFEFVGLVSGTMRFSFTNCETGCWAETDLYEFTESDLVDLYGDWAIGFSNATFDLYGEREYCPMGYSPWTFSQIVDAPAGSCGPVASQTQSWGSLKAQFR